MRVVLGLVCATALAACGAGHVVTTPASTTTAMRAGGSAEQLMAAAGRPDAPGPEALIAALGAPDVDRREGAGAMLAWRLPGCALALGFATDGAGRLRLRVAQADPPTLGGAAPTLAQCASQAQARRAGSGT